MRSLPLAILLAPAVLAACASEPTAAPTCPSARLTAADTISDYRVRVPQQMAALPPDSVVELVVDYEGAVTDADLALVAEYGGTVKYAFQTMPALGLLFRAGDVAAFVAALPADRVRYVDLGAPICIQALGG